MVPHFAPQDRADEQHCHHRDDPEVFLHHVGTVALVGLGVELAVVAELEVVHGAFVVFLHQQVLADADVGGLEVGAQAQHFFVQLLLLQ